MKIAASMASKSKHPLSQALLEAYSGEIDQIEVQEVQGCGLVSRNYKLGKASWVGAKSVDDNPDFWLHNGSELHRFAFADALRSDTKEVVAELKKTGFPVYLISGDRKSVVEKIAAELGIENYLSEVTPIDKVKFIESLNKKVLMVGDGLNDAAALKTASVSMSPSTAVDITQNAADIVFQGEKLQPILTAIDVARKSGKLVSQNFALSMLYNVIAVPMAVLGYVTPLIAAIAMSSSSIIVVMNSMRLRMKGVKWM